MRLIIWLLSFLIIISIVSCKKEHTATKAQNLDLIKSIRGIDSAGNVFVVTQYFYDSSNNLRLIIMNGDSTFVLQIEDTIYHQWRNPHTHEFFPFTQYYLENGLAHPTGYLLYDQFNFTGTYHYDNTSRIDSVEIIPSIPSFCEQGYINQGMTYLNGNCINIRGMAGTDPNCGFCSSCHKRVEYELAFSYSDKPNSINYKNSGRSYLGNLNSNAADSVFGMVRFASSVGIDVTFFVGYKINNQFDASDRIIQTNFLPYGLLDLTGQIYNPYTLTLEAFPNTFEIEYY